MTVEIRDGKVTCSKSMMNYLSIILVEASKYYSERGLNALALKAEEDANLIFGALCDCHYYDDI